MMYYLGSHCWLWGGGGCEALQTPCGDSARGGAEGGKPPNMISGPLVARSAGLPTYHWVGWWRHDLANCCCPPPRFASPSCAPSSSARLGEVVVVVASACCLQAVYRAAAASCRAS